MASVNEKLQRWLLEIEKGLGELSPADRGKTIFDLDSRVRAELGDDETLHAQKIDTVLAALGTPAQVIDKTRADRGLAISAASPASAPPVPPTKPAKNPTNFWKWAMIILVGGFFSILALLVIIPIVIIKFISSSGVTPGFKHTFNISTFGGDASTYHLKGTQSEEGLEHLILHATNGTIVVKSGKPALTYDCTLKGDHDQSESPISYPDDATIAFNFDGISADDNVVCTFEMTKDMSADLSLTNGNVSASNMSRDFKTTLDNGKIDFGKSGSVLFLVNASASVGQIQGLDDFNKAQVGMKADAPHARADLKVNAGQIIIEK